jgi:hypothetical protein
MVVDVEVDVEVEVLVEVDAVARVGRQDGFAGGRQTGAGGTCPDVVGGCGAAGG